STSTARVTPGGGPFIFRPVGLPLALAEPTRTVTLARMAVEPAEAEEIRNHLVRYTGWDKVPEEVMKTFSESAHRVALKRTRPLFRRGDPGPGLFLVRSGEFKLSLISSEGREQILYLAGAGKLIGEGFLPREVQCAASAFAMSDG